MTYKFTEVLNDLIDYFILGDILLLESWKEDNNLSTNLAEEFTQNESGDRVFNEGIIFQMIDLNFARKQTDCNLEEELILLKWKITCLCFLHGVF